jgi:NAD(P)H dehydrogenase (quinone)
MASVVVVYHSGYGHTTKQAEAVAKGASADLIAINESGEITDADWAKLEAAKAIVMGSPTYMGTVSWQFKKFADASSKVWFSQGWKNKLFAGFTNSASLNGDKGTTISYLMTLAMQHSGIWAGTGIMPASMKANSRSDVNSLGGFSGALMATPADASADEVNPADLETARLLGVRVAELAAKL